MDVEARVRVRIPSDGRHYLRYSICETSGNDCVEGERPSGGLAIDRPVPDTLKELELAIQDEDHEERLRIICSNVHRDLVSFQNHHNPSVPGVVFDSIDRTIGLGPQGCYLFLRSGRFAQEQLS